MVVVERRRIRAHPCMSIICPTCGARPTKPCIQIGDPTQLKRWPHPERKRVFREQVEARRNGSTV